MSGITTTGKGLSEYVKQKAERAAIMDIKPLLIAGGLSTRMGSPKHLLPFPDGRPSYQHTLEQLHRTFPSAETLYISLRDESQWESLNTTPCQPELLRVQPIYDQVRHPDGSTSWCTGPAAGLLSAYALSPTTTWLLAGCDYPLLTAEALQELLQSYVAPVTCFANAEGYCEPLLGVWSPAALEMLKQDVAKGRLGPSNVVRQMGGKLVRPSQEQWIFGTNTKEDWDAAMKIFGGREPI